nr:MAG TPA: hypothetical protein [Caudoviricetes sp.]
MSQSTINQFISPIQISEKPSNHKASQIFLRFGF